MNEQYESTEDVLQMLQQKIGNLELTVHSMMEVLDEEGILDETDVTLQAQEIVKEMQTEIEKDELDISTD
jgi:hypothetical protein